MASSGEKSIFEVDYRGRVAVITIDNVKKLNAISMWQYYELSQKLKEIETHDEVYVTVIMGKGRFFSAGADVSISRESPSDPSEAHKLWLTSFVANNVNTTRTFAMHSKILVVGLNGPVVGLSAALVAFADFVYCAPHAFLLTPFSSLGLVAEGGASQALVARMGIAKANEALIMSKRISAEEMQQCGFVNAIFDVGKGEDAKFRERVLHEVDERLGPHLNGDSMKGIKSLIRRPQMDALNLQNVHEAFAGLDRFVKGIPQEEFRKIASGEKRHKL